MRLDARSLRHQKDTCYLSGVFLVKSLFEQTYYLSAVFLPYYLSGVFLVKSLFKRPYYLSGKKPFFKATW